MGGHPVPKVRSPPRGLAAGKQRYLVWEQRLDRPDARGSISAQLMSSRAPGSPRGIVNPPSGMRSVHETGCGVTCERGCPGGRLVPVRWRHSGAGTRPPRSGRVAWQGSGPVDEVVKDAAGRRLGGSADEGMKGNARDGTDWRKTHPWMGGPDASPGPAKDPSACRRLSWCPLPGHAPGPPLPPMLTKRLRCLRAP